MKFIFEIIEIKYRLEEFRKERGAKFFNFLQKLWQKKLNFGKNLIADNFAKNLVILAIILLSILGRSSQDFGAISAYNLFNENNPENINKILSYNNLNLLNLLAIFCNYFAKLLKVNSIFIAEIVINSIGVLSILISNKILKNSNNFEKNLLLILSTIIYFLPFENFEKNEFFHDYSINLALILPIICYLYIGQNNLTVLAKFIYGLLLAILILQNIYFIILIPILNYEFFINPKKNYQNFLLQIIILIALSLDLAIIKYCYNLWFGDNNLIFLNLLKIYANSIVKNYKNSFESFKIIGFSRIYYDFLVFFILYFLAFLAFFALNKDNFNKNFLALISSLLIIYFAQNFDNQIANLLLSILVFLIIFNLKFYHFYLVKKFYKYWFLFLIFLIASTYAIDFKFLVTHLIFWGFPLIFLIIFYQNFRHKIWFYQNIGVVLLIILLSGSFFPFSAISPKLYFAGNFFVAIWTIFYLVKNFDFNEKLKKPFHSFLVLVIIFVVGDFFRNCLKISHFNDYSSKKNQIILQNIFEKTNLSADFEQKILQISADPLDFSNSQNYFSQNIDNLALNILNYNDVILFNNYQIKNNWFSIIHNYQEDLLDNFINNFSKKIKNPQQKYLIFYNNDLCNIGLLEFLLRNHKFNEIFFKNFDYFDNFQYKFFNYSYKTKPLKDNLSDDEFELINEIHLLNNELGQMPIFEIYKKTN